MNSIRIDTGIKRISINDDPTRIIEFNPGDVVFAEKFYQLLREFQIKQAEYQERSKALEANVALDENGLPTNLTEAMAFLREVCEYMRGQIDWLFGPGTSQVVFGDALNLEMFSQFFEGLTPFIQAVREEKLSRYTNSKLNRVMK